MIVVKIELWPRGRESLMQEIGRVVIANNGAGDAQQGLYNAALAHAGKFVHKPGAWKSATGIPFWREFSPYHLLLAALQACLKREGRADPSLIDYSRDGAGDRVVAEAAAKAAAVAA